MFPLGLSVLPSPAVDSPLISTSREGGTFTVAGTKVSTCDFAASSCSRSISPRNSSSLAGFVEPWELACVPWHRVPTHTPFPAYRSAASLARSPQQHARATTLRRPDENATFQLPLAETTQDVVSTRPLPMLSKIRNTDPLTAILHAISSRHRCRHVTPLRMHKGRELDDDKTLKDLGVEEEGSTIVTVRKVLVAEGWKIIQEDDEDSDTEEDDF